MAMTAAIRPVLVGVDGSSSGERALEWALREALVRKAPVRVVTVWSWDGRDMAPTRTLRPGVTSSRPAGRARQLQEALVARVLAAFGRPAPQVMAEIAEGDPASELIERSSAADLLVLGSAEENRPHTHSYASVTQTCVRYAGCPVVVIPAEAPAAQPSDQD